MVQLLAGVALAAQLVAASDSGPPPAPGAEIRGEALMDSLRAGGYTILLRHARTDRSFKEEMGSVPVERGAQRNLTEEGVRDAKLMGIVLEKYRIPIGEIVSSPMFRTRETAEHAAGAPRLTMALRAWPSTEEQAALVAAVPEPGTNRLLVTHHFVIEKHVPGIRPGDVGESEAAVVRPDGRGGVKLVGRITLADWETLAGVPAHGDASRTAHVFPSLAHGGYRSTPADTLAAVSLPDTPAGRLARSYLAAFNSGDAARMRLFIDTALVADPDRTTDERMRSYAETFRRLGPFAAIDVQHADGDEIRLRARASGGEYVIVTRASADQPGRAASISIMLGTAAGRHP